MKVNIDELMESLQSELDNKQEDEFTTQEWATKFNLNSKKAYDDLMKLVDMGKVERRQQKRKHTIYWRKVVK